VFKVILWETNPTTGALQRHDLSGSTAWYMHIRLTDGSSLHRQMLVDGVPTLGVLRYAWLPTDWDPVSAGGTIGGLAPAPWRRVEYCMEYEVLGPGGARLTFPNGGDSLLASYDVLCITADLGDG
jgi:hypothetical protein